VRRRHVLARRAAQLHALPRGDDVREVRLRAHPVRAGVLLAWRAALVLGEGAGVLVLYSALVATEVAAEWVQEILRRTLLSPSLSAQESRFLKALSRVLRSSLQGIEQGWNARQALSIWVRFWRSPIAKQHRVATDARAIRFAQEMIERIRKGL
jgi:hypothetical protein